MEVISTNVSMRFCTCHRVALRDSEISGIHSLQDWFQPVTRYRRTIEVDQPAAPVFDYLARFSNGAEWDPGVARAAMVTPEPVGVGSTFDIGVKVFTLEVPYVYEISAFEHPTRVVLRAETTSVTSEDTITVVDNGNGTCLVTYDADLRLRGILRVADPLLGIMFRRIGDRALAGLQKTLDGWQVSSA